VHIGLPFGPTHCSCRVAVALGQTIVIDSRNGKRRLQISAICRIWRHSGTPTVPLGTPVTPSRGTGAPGLGFYRVALYFQGVSGCQAATLDRFTARRLPLTAHPLATYRCCTCSLLFLGSLFSETAESTAFSGAGELCLGGSVDYGPVCWRNFRLAANEVESRPKAKVKSSLRVCQMI